jgi:hypothetical protein
VPTLPPGKDDVVMLTGAGDIVMLKLWVSEKEFLSTTITVKFAVPGLDGVPLI